MPEDEVDQLAVQKRDLDAAVRVAMFAVNSLTLDYREDIQQLPSQAQTRIVVQAALGYLIGESLITVAPEKEWKRWLPVTIADHLRPDISGQLDAHREMVRRLLNSD
jgi:hypothetical protein